MDPMLDPLHEARRGVGLIAKQKWLEQDRPHMPFGFAFLTWAIEVHCKLMVPKDGDLYVRLIVSRVQPSGKLFELCQVRS